MTQPVWKTLAPALLLLAAGVVARAQCPACAAKGAGEKATGCCPVVHERTIVVGGKAGCCAPSSTTATVGSSCCAKSDKGCACCAKDVADSCCEDCAKGCSCCTKSETKTAGCACCAKADKGPSCCCGDSKGCACCAKNTKPAAAACACCGKACDCAEGKAKAKGEKSVAIIIMPGTSLPGMMPMPGMMPFPPVPPIAWAEPLPPPAPGMGPVYPCPPDGPLPPPAVGQAPDDCPPPIRPAVRVAPPAPPMAAPPPAVVCSVAQPARTEAHACSVRVASEDGTPCLEIHGAGDTRMTCDHLALKVAGRGPVKLTVCNQQIAVSCPCMQAKADRIEVQEGENRLVLDGHVRLEYRWGAEERGEVMAEHVVLNLTKGQVEIKPAAGPSGPAHTGAVMPASFEQAVQFWTGFYH